jgi:hypothetical protein
MIESLELKAYQLGAIGVLLEGLGVFLGLVGLLR